MMLTARPKQDEMDCGIKAGLFRACLMLAAAAFAGCSAASTGSSSYTSLRAAPSPTEMPPRTEVASWYGPGFNGRRTASGEVFHQSSLTAASPTLPMGSRVRVTNLSNGRSVVVRITDRGPFVRGRGIDLSRGAAEQIGMARTGVGRVRISRLDDPSADLLSPRHHAQAEARTHRKAGASRFATARLEPVHDWVGRVRMTPYHRHSSRRRSRIISDPVGTWLMSALPRFN